MTTIDFKVTGGICSLCNDVEQPIPNEEALRQFAELHRHHPWNVTIMGDVTASGQTFAASMKYETLVKGDG